MHSKQQKMRTTAFDPGNSSGSKKKKNETVSFRDNRSEALQLKKMQDLAQSVSAPIQFVTPKPLSVMLGERASKSTDHGTATKDEIFESTDMDRLKLEVFILARDHNLGLDGELGLSQEYLAVAPDVARMISDAVQEAVDSSGVLLEQAVIFQARFSKRLVGNDRLSNLGKWLFQRARNNGAAEQYLENLVHKDQEFNFGFNEDEGIQYRTPKEKLLGPSQSELDIGTQIANRVLREAFEGKDQQDIYFRIAAGIRNTMDSSHPSLKIASNILTHYLKPKIMEFVYRLPLADQEDDGNIWGGLTLNDGIMDAEENEVGQNDSIRPKVQGAWEQIRAIVSPAVLNHSGRVRVQVGGWFDRAFYRDKRIHVGSVSGSKAIIMHEFGHHLEDNAAAPHWIKLQQLMRDRSNGTELKQIFPFTIPYVISKDEMRYDTDLPASGEMGGYFGYNVKYYDHGSTEVVSTTFEVFHDPEKAFKIAVKDPGMFLAVMGVLRGK